MPVFSRPGRVQKLAVYDGLNCLYDEAQVIIAPASAQARFDEGTVFVQPVFTGVRNADDDGLDTFLAQGFHRLVNLPLAGKAGRCVKQILAVVHVNDWKAAAVTI